MSGLALIAISAIAQSASAQTYSLTDLGTLGGLTSTGVAINVSGQVTGSAGTPGGAIHAFISNGTTMTDLGTLGGLVSSGYAINASGQGTGYAEAGTPAGGVVNHAFISDGTAMTDLATLVVGSPLASHVTLYAGTAINDAGWIVANGTDSLTGNTHAYLLKPNRDCSHEQSNSDNEHGDRRDDCEPPDHGDHGDHEHGDHINGEAER